MKFSTSVDQSFCESLVMLTSTQIAINPNTGEKTILKNEESLQIYQIKLTNIKLVRKKSACEQNIININTNIDLLD